MAEVERENTGSKKERKRLNEAETGKDVQQILLSYLDGDRRWYAWRSQFHNWVWNGLTFLVVFLGAAASIMAALNEGAPPGQEINRIYLVGLPALSALCGALLAQFRFKEACRIRDQGRISTERLICQAHLLPTESRAEALAKAIDIRLAAHRLEEEQLGQITGGGDRLPRDDPSKLPP